MIGRVRRRARELEKKRNRYTEDEKTIKGFRYRKGIEETNTCSRISKIDKPCASYSLASTEMKEQFFQSISISNDEI